MVELIDAHMVGVSNVEDDSMEWVTFAVRESTIKTLEHGNNEKQQEQVLEEFQFN